MTCSGSIRAAACFGALLVGALTYGCSDEADPSTAIVFSDLRAEEITDTRAVIRFTTSIPTTCEVEYGLDPENLDRSADDPSMIDDELDTEHEVPLEDLEPGTTYYYRGFAVASDGSEDRSVVASFDTLVGDGVDRENVALLSFGATVTDVSSNFGNAANDEAWGADSAFDGQMGTEWATHGDGNDAYVVVQLPAPTSVAGFGFRGREMADGSSIIQSVRVQLDGASPLGPFQTPDPDRLYTFDLSPTDPVHTVRIEAASSTGGNTGAREIQIFAAPD